MIVIITIFLLINLLAFFANISQPMYRWNFDLIFGLLSALIYNFAILIALVEIKELKKKLRGEQ